MMRTKVTQMNDALSGIPDGAHLMIGGFGGAGAPLELIHALIDRFIETGHPKNLTIINNNAGNGGVGIAAMIRVGMVKTMICSFPRSSNADAFNTAYRDGQIELILVPQGTLAERIRAGGAGIPAFYTPTAFGTDLAKGKATQDFDGKTYVQERWLKADYALIKAECADTIGNLTYRMAARNFAPLMAMAAETTIVQARNVVEPGEINPEIVTTPGIFVDHIVDVPHPNQEEAMVREGIVYA